MINVYKISTESIDNQYEYYCPRYCMHNVCTDKKKSLGKCENAS